MDRQQFLNRTYQYFEIAEFRGHDGEHCVYSGARMNEDGQVVDVHCAIGCQIPTWLYHDSMEQKSASDLITDHPEVAEFFGIEDDIDDDALFLDDVQGAHDEAADVREVLERLRNVAAQYNLTVPSVL